MRTIRETASSALLTLSRLCFVPNGQYYPTGNERKRLEKLNGKLLNASKEAHAAKEA